MNYTELCIALQEVPGEISICFSITGCSLKCNGCHSSFLWKKENGKKLTLKTFTKILDTYKNLASCVLFMGGDWYEKELINFLKIAKSNNYKTCLYTGEEKVSTAILNELTWIKTGPWIEELGGLDVEITNQKFIEVKTNKILNHLFQKKESYDKIDRKTS